MAYLRRSPAEGARIELSKRPNLLVTGPRVKGRFSSLSRYARVHWLDELSEKELDTLLPSIDCMLLQSWWPDALGRERVARMARLRFIQSGWAGVNHIPFEYLSERVVVSSNAGGFSVGVAEHAMALLLAGAKRVVRLDGALRTGRFETLGWDRLVGEVALLDGKTLGVLGYGGIGQAAGSMAKAFGMDVIAFSRHPSGTSVPIFQGREGLLEVLRRSDAVVIALPLSKLTTGLIGRAELDEMKSDAVLVNVARAEIVDERAIYEHLVSNPGFTYATDVWRLQRGKETYASEFPFLKLPNFIGTPHVAGGSTAKTGDPGRRAMENLLRFLKKEAPRNVVERSEYR